MQTISNEVRETIILLFLLLLQVSAINNENVQFHAVEATDLV